MKSHLSVVRPSDFRRWAGLFAVCTLLSLLVPWAATADAQVPPPASAFISASGSNLVLGGQSVRFIGYNLPCAQPFLLDTGQLDYVLANIADNSGATALRMWFFQSNGGPGNWGPFDQVIAAAKAHGMRIIPTMVNEWPTCEPVTAATQPRKTLSWYQAGYHQAGDGYPLSFRDFAVQVAAHYADEPAIAFWQLVNEAEAPTLQPGGGLTCDEPTAAGALRAFGDDMSAALHTADSHHLVSLGTLGGSQCGLAGADFSYIHAGTVDLCEYHDYNDPLNPLGTGQVDGLAARLNQCRNLPGGGKPLFVGEAGIVNNVQPTGPQPAPGSGPPLTLESLQTRARLFHDKITAAFNAGVAGYQIWFKGPAFSSADESFAIGDGDPTEAMMRSVPLTGPPATVPESSANILLPLSAIVVLGGGGAVIWRRKRRAEQG